MNEETKKSVGIVGVGAAACAVCCAGPILAFLAGLGVAGLASTLLIGGLGLLIAAAVAGFLIVRRLRTATCATPPAPVALADPTRRTAETLESR